MNVIAIKSSILLFLSLSSIPLMCDAAKESNNFDDSYIASLKHPAWFKDSFLNLKDDLDVARGAGKIGLMIFVSTEACSYCDQFIKTSLSDKNIKEIVQNNFDVIGLEIFNDNELTDLQGNVMTVKDYVFREKARFTPTIIFYGEDGKRLLKIVGYYPPDKFRRTLSYLIEKKYKVESLRSYLRNTETNKTKKASLNSDYDFLARPPHILDRRLAAADRPLMVIFEEPGCEPCGRFHANVLTDENVLKWANKFEAVHLDMTNNSPIVQIPTGEKISAKAWSEKLGLNYSPAIVFFDEKGNEIIRLDAEVLKYRMAGTLEFVYDKGYLQDSQFNRWRAIKAREKKSKN